MNVIQLLIFVELSWRDKNAIQGKGTSFRLRAKQMTCPVKMPCYFLSYRYKHNFELPTVTKVALNFSYVYRAKIARMLDIIHM